MDEEPPRHDESGYAVVEEIAPVASIAPEYRRADLGRRGRVEEDAPVVPGVPPAMTIYSRGRPTRADSRATHPRPGANIAPDVGRITPNGASGTGKRPAAAS
jgi:hypothetical protein